MKYILRNTLFVLFTLTIVSCEEFLSRRPTKGTSQPVESIDQLEGLMNAGFSTEYGYPFVLSTDDVDFSIESYEAAGFYGTYIYSYLSMLHYTFDTDEISNEISDLLTMYGFSDIYRANLIIESIGGVEGDETDKQRLKADAHFMRAYWYWVLANVYCLPYCEANLDEPGLPRRLGIDMEENTTQMTVGETYELIESDLAEAMKTDIVSSEKKWRGSKSTASALLSRVYLHKCEYEKAVESATYALSNKHNTVKLRDFNTLTQTEGSPGLFYPETAYLSSADIMTWDEFFLSNTISNLTMWVMPSNELMGLYDQANDMRYTKFFINTYLIYGMSVQQLGYHVFANAMSYPGGIGIAEVMLNKAEALVRQPSPDIGGAMALVNELREKRLAPGAPGMTLTASTKEEALTKILEERRRELVISHRWYDIRRFSVNETTSDDVTVTHTFYKLENGQFDKTAVETYTLPVGSRRYAVPYNGFDVANSEGQLKQNRY